MKGLGVWSGATIGTPFGPFDVPNKLSPVGVASHQIASVRVGIRPTISLPLSPELGVTGVFLSLLSQDFIPVSQIIRLIVSHYPPQARHTILVYHIFSCLSITASQLLRPAGTPLLRRGVLLGADPATFHLEVGKPLGHHAVVGPAVGPGGYLVNQVPDRGVEPSLEGEPDAPELPVGGDHLDPILIIGLVAVGGVGNDGDPSGCLPPLDVIVLE